VICLTEREREREREREEGEERENFVLQYIFIPANSANKRPKGYVLQLLKGTKG